MSSIGGITEATRERRFTVGEWTVEPDLDKISKAGEERILEPLIMELLVYLAEHPDETVSTDELVQNVWSGRAMSDQPVYQGIAQLRKALDDEARRPRYVATVTKRGYRLVAEVVWQDVTPAPIAVDVRQRPRFSSWTPFLSLVLAGSYFFLSTSDVSVSRERGLDDPFQFGSIAVLPFVDMSPDQSQQYLGDGLAEEVIHRMAGMPDLRVVARTSSFAFRDRDTDIKTIGEQLGAEVILEGSIRRSGDRLRVTAQLINASDGYHIWSQIYEPVGADAFGLQDQIAASVAELIQVGGPETVLPVRSFTQNTDAADAYYLGLFHMHKRRADSLDRALEYFNLALSYDPQFALAYAALGRSYFLASDARYGNVPDDEAMRESAAAMDMAAALDDKLPAVLVHQAEQAMDVEDAEKAESLILEAIGINPNRAETYQTYGLLLAFTERYDEALAARQKAVELDPLSPLLRFQLGRSYMQQNRVADAEQQYQRAIELDPDWHIPYLGLAGAISDRDPAKSMSLFKKAATMEGPEARLAGRAALVVGYRYLTLGDFDAAEKWHSYAEDSGWSPWVCASNRIHLYLAQDRFKDAEALLSQWERDFPERPGTYTLGGLYRMVLRQYPTALAYFERAKSFAQNDAPPELFNDDFLQWGYVPAVHLAYLHKLNGEPQETERLLEQSEQYIDDFEKLHSKGDSQTFVRASINVVRGNRQEALTLLGEAIDDGWMRLWFLQRDPIWESLQGDPEFEMLADRIAVRIAEIRQAIAQSPDSNVSL